MNLRKLVTVIAAAFALCILLQVPCQATTKATTDEDQVREYTESELRYMTSIIYCEARGESYAGQKAVGIVVMNRKKSEQFPNSVKGVIYQRGQFSPVRNGHMSKALSLYDEQVESGKMTKVMKTCRKAAIEALQGSTTVKVNGKSKEMKNYLFFSRRIRNAKYTLGGHQFR